MNTIEQLRQVQDALECYQQVEKTNFCADKDGKDERAAKRGVKRKMQKALALMPAIIAQVEEMGKAATEHPVVEVTAGETCRLATGTSYQMGGTYDPAATQQPDALVPTSLAECKSADEYNALLDRRLAAKGSDDCRTAFEKWYAAFPVGGRAAKEGLAWTTWQAAWSARPSERESALPGVDVKMLRRKSRRALFGKDGILKEHILSIAEAVEIVIGLVPTCLKRESGTLDERTKMLVRFGSTASESTWNKVFAYAAHWLVIDNRVAIEKCNDLSEQDTQDAIERMAGAIVADPITGANNYVSDAITQARAAMNALLERFDLRARRQE